MTGPDLLGRLLPARDATDASELAERRCEGRTWLADHGLPTTRDEAWRYTALGRLNDERFDLFQGAAVQGEAAVTVELIDEIAGSHGGARIVFLNGTWNPELSTVAGVPTGVEITSASAAGASRAQAGPSGARTDGFIALNHALASDAATITVGEDLALEAPIHVVHVSMPTTEAAVHPVTVITVAPGARATVIESWVGTSGPVLVNGSTTITVADRAKLDYYRIQAEHPESVHLGATNVTVGDHGTFTAIMVTTGADVARTALDVTLVGDDAVATLDGLYIPVANQHHDNVITIQHSASNGHSHQRFRGIIDDSARGSFTGHVIVDVGTAGNDADQSNRSLLLTSRSESDTRPWLEILADDVQCSHGATVGQLDDGALFYLRSRGIPEARAREILIEAFGSAITDEIELESLRDHVAEMIARRRGRVEVEL